MRMPATVGAAMTCLATLAAAQNAEPQQGSWSETLMAAFFTDAEAPELRPEEDVRANWQRLSQEERDEVLADCAAMGLDPATMEDGDAQITDDPVMGEDPAARDEHDPGPDDPDEPTVEGVADERISLTAWTRLCNLVETH